jgi:branched-chain amino acid transport system substrate-binding protein
MIKTAAASIARTGLASFVISASATAQGVSDGVVKIGVMTDLSGPYSAIGGAGSAAAARLAIQDFSKDGTVLGKKIELVVGDHQQKADVASTLARQWLDRDQVDMITDLSGSVATLAVMEVAEQKHKLALVTGGFSLAVTNERCNAYTVQWVGDFYPLTTTLPARMVKAGKKRWFFVTADYSAGKYVEEKSAEAVKAAGGEVLGSARAPLGTLDFSSYMLRAQSSKADVVALANTGLDAVNSIKTASEFGLMPKQTVVPLFLFITEIDSLGLAKMQGANIVEFYYWNQNARSRTWARRFFEAHKRMPTSVQAGVYSSVTNYLKAVAAAGTDDSDAVMAALKRTPIDDGLFKGTIRADGRLIHDMLLVEIKRPADSQSPWDYYNIKATIPGAEAAQPLSESKCKLVATAK